MVCWTISRYGYELRVNGEQILTNSSGNWNPDALFDRINGDSSMEIGELVLFPRALENSEKESMEGYLGHKWAMMSFFPSSHPYRNQEPVGKPGLVLNGTVLEAGTFNLTVTASNIWGSDSQDFVFNVGAMPPRIKLLKPEKSVQHRRDCLRIWWTPVAKRSKLVSSWGTDPLN